MTILFVTLPITLLLEADWRAVWTNNTMALFVTLGRAGGRNTAIQCKLVDETDLMVAAETDATKVHAHVSAFDFIFVATEVAVLLMVVSRVATGEVTFTGGGRGGGCIVWTASCARQASRADGVLGIAIHIVASVGAATSGGQTAPVLGVPEAKGDVAALAGVGLVGANVAA